MRCAVDAMDAALVKSPCHATAAIEEILRSLAVFADGTPAADDQTLLAMKIE
jgi:serine phosphatase RsbU (regulator of sigma subunit)